VILRPNQPTMFDTFLYSLVDELRLLNGGVPA
jgi:hypothetical protein